MNNCPTISLSEVVDSYLVHKFNDGRKYYKNYLVIGLEVWKQVFNETMFSMRNEYMELKKGEPYNYIDVPPDMQRYLSSSVKDKCDNLKPLFYNQNLDVIIKPKRKACGCEDKFCDCAGLCDAIGGLVVNTKEVIIDNPDSSPPGQPTTYTEYQWLKYCPNGDIFEYRQIPTTQYTFARGSYDDSYDISYEIGESSSQVVVYTLSRKLCSLKVLPCGCPAQCPENEQLFFNHCGCYLNTFNPSINLRNRWYDECNFWAGEVKMSDCGTKIFVKHVECIEKNHHILLSYQTNGINIDGSVQVPNNMATKMCMYAGIEYHRIVFNDRYNKTQKDDAFYKYVDTQNELIKWLNPISEEWARALPTVAVW